MSKRRQEQIQHGKPKPADTNVTRMPDTASATAMSGGPASDGGATDANVLGKYWIAIIVWGIGFTMMIVFEVFAAVFRR